MGTATCLYLRPFLGDVDEAATPSHALDAGQGETVPIVDDEPTVRMLTADLLSEAGYAVIKVEDSLQGLKLLQAKRRINLLIIDAGLPGSMTTAGRRRRVGAPSGVEGAFHHRLRGKCGRG
jgi:hypothetical protein